MRKNKILLFGLIFFAPLYFSCLWDNDTLEMESQKFPELIDVVAGNFLRHSDAFYKWRIVDRRKQLSNTPDSLVLIDDLAVSHIKLNQNKKAISILKDQLNIDSNRYETLANLGTAYIHDNELEQGVKYIERAIEINPNAHFGREKYQKYVAEYLIKKKYKKGQPICNYPKDANDRSKQNFYAYILKQEGIKPFDKSEEKYRTEAVEGIVGMMKFGNFDSPVLLECLGDILIGTGYGDKETDLSSIIFQHLDNVFHKNEWSILLQSNSMVKRDYARNFKSYSTYLNKKLDSVLALGNQKFDVIQKDEREWIASGLNPELEFGYKYYGKERPKKVTEPIVKTDNSNQKDTLNQEIEKNDSFLTTLIISILGAIVVLVIVLYIFKRK
jgi:tetratricopeptide (TPR) repeat protein